MTTLILKDTVTVHDDSKNNRHRVDKSNSFGMGYVNLLTTSQTLPVKWQEKKRETEENPAEVNRKRHDGARIDLGLTRRTSSGTISVFFSLVDSLCILYTVGEDNDT